MIYISEIKNKEEKVKKVEDAKSIKNIEEKEGNTIYYCIDCGNCIEGCCIIKKLRMPDKSHLGVPSPYYHFGCEGFNRIITIERLCENFQRFGAYWSNWDTKLKDEVIKFLIQEIIKIEKKNNLGGE